MEYIRIKKMTNKKFTKNLNNIIFESIYSNKATVYHRTKIEDLINKIYNTGFRAGVGDTYGKGFYSTYELESQFRQRMKSNYGDIIVKFMINSLNRFMFFDYDQFLKSSVSKKIKTSKDMFIIDQMKYFGFDKYDKYKQIDEKKILELQKTSNYSSHIASYVYNVYKKLLIKIIDGIVFTGRHDGLVLVSYNNDIIIPLSYSDNEGKSWRPANKDINYLKKVFSQNSDTSKQEQLSLYIKNYDELIKKNISKDAVYTTYLHDQHEIKINWEKGDWYNGTWEGGQWENGIWWGGTWEDGTWHKGTWKDGVWKDGTWWVGIWWGGTWEDGVWHKGTWKNGVWEYGTWFKGIWEDGIWENGAWYKGTWKNGVWKGGYDKYGDYHSEGDSPDKWSKK
jgi:hypothetical protein